MNQSQNTEGIDLLGKILSEWNHRLLSLREVYQTHHDTVALWSNKLVLFGKVHTTLGTLTTGTYAMLKRVDVPLKWTYPYIGRVVMTLLLVDAKVEVLTHNTSLLSTKYEIDSWW